MGTLDPEGDQELLGVHDEMDGVPVRMSSHQAQNFGALVGAGRAGHAAYASA
jgi:hypothetical protein